MVQYFLSLTIVSRYLFLPIRSSSCSKKEMKIILFLTLLSQLIAISKAQAEVTYLFSEGGGTPICPTIMTSLSIPSLRLEPSSSNPEFLNGSYQVPANVNNIIPGGRFTEEYGPCANNPSLMCSKLSLLYSMDESVGRGSFTVTYTASNGVTRRIEIEFGYEGIYRQSQEPNQVLGRLVGSPNFLSDSILVYGTFSPLVLCYENGTEETEAMFISNDDDQMCSSDVANIRPNIQPGRFDVLVPMDIAGQHRVYVAVGVCTSQTRSIMFDVNFDRPTTDGPGTTTPGPTTTPPTSTGIPLGAVIGGIIGGLALVGVTVVIIIVSCFIWYKTKRKKGPSVTENGLLHCSQGTERCDPGASPELHGNHSDTDGLLLNHEPPSQQQLPNRKLYVVSYIDPEKTKMLVQKLYEWFSDLIPTQLPGENGNFNSDLMRITGEQHRVIILGDIRESSHQNKNARDWISHFNSFPVFTEEQLRYVFLVRFRTNEIISGYKLKQIPVPEHPDDSDFDPAEVAKFIHEKIEDVIASYSQNQLNQYQTSDCLSRQPNGHSSQSTPQSTPHQPVQPRPSTSDLASEISEPVNETEDVEPQDRTSVSADTEQDTAKADSELKTTGQTQTHLTNPRVSDLKGTTQGSPKPGGLKSPSGASLKEYIDEKFENLSMAIKKQGEDIKEEVGKTGTEIKDKVGKTGTEIKDKVEKKGDEIEDKVEKKGDEIEAKVGEGGDKLQQSIELVVDATEQVRIEIENQKLKVDKRHSDDEDDWEKETGDLGSAPIKQDRP